MDVKEVDQQNKGVVPTAVVDLLSRLDDISTRVLKDSDVDRAEIQGLIDKVVANDEGLDFPNAARAELLSALLKIKVENNHERVRIIEGIAKAISSVKNVEMGSDDTDLSGLLSDD